MPLFKKDFKKNDGESKKKRGQGIVHVSNLFQRYQSILKAPQGIVVTAFIACVEVHFNCTIKKDQCVYNVATQTLTLRVPGMLKSEILLQKKAILAELSDVLGAKNAPREIL